MNYEAKIKELTARIEKLEKAEAKRVVKKRIKIILKIIKYLIIITLILIGYNYINNKYIKPYKETIDNLNTKFDTVESVINNKWESLQKYNPFN